MGAVRIRRALEPNRRFECHTKVTLQFFGHLATAISANFVYLGDWSAENADACHRVDCIVENSTWFGHSHALDRELALVSAIGAKSGQPPRLTAESERGRGRGNAHLP